jgi:RNA polymerase sigma-70 factor (ECF subfamily)
VETSEPEPAVEPEELQHCLAILSPEHREVLMLRFFEEMDYEEIARVTGSTLGTVRSRIHYAKRALRRAFEDKLYELKPQ